MYSIYTYIYIYIYNCMIDLTNILITIYIYIYIYIVIYVQLDTCTYVAPRRRPNALDARESLIHTPGRTHNRIRSPRLAASGR